MSDLQLMQAIKTKWGAELARLQTSIPASFFAALIANESGGDETAQRFEPAVFGTLAQVLLGRKASYGSIYKPNIESFTVDEAVQIGGSGLTRAAFVTLTLQRLAQLATSYGLVQIMGYEAIAFHLDGVQRLADPASELPIACKMITDFAERFQFDVTKDFEDMFTCWNTGRPHGTTFDPNYVPNGLARKVAYEALP